MVIRNQPQALCMAIEMEKRAIKVYQRALMMATSDESREAITEILHDEQDHLSRFSAKRDACDRARAEERLMSQALAAEVLFPGGVMAMQREEALKDMRSVYAYAAESEQTAVEKYTEFAKKCEQPEIAAIFLQIAQEEAGHLQSLRKRLAEMEE